MAIVDKKIPARKARTGKELVNADDIKLQNLRYYINAKGTKVVINGFANWLEDSQPVVIFCNPSTGKIYTTFVSEFKKKFELVGSA